MHDVIIVGAGPSGSSAARIAGKNGLKTLLIEKETFPRNKPCAGALSRQALSYLDFEIPEYLQEKDIFGARVHYKGQVVEIQKKDRIATLVTRAGFDAYLLEKAKETGITVNMPEKVLHYTENRDYVEVQTENGRYRSKYLIIASGYQGILGNAVRGRESRDKYSVSLVAEIPADNHEIEQFIGNAVDIHFGVASEGYGWIFPHDTYYSVGIVGLARDFSSPKKAFFEFLEANGFHDACQFSGHKLPVGGFKRTNTSKRTILCGDAGGFVDPFSGEGISYAIRSGQIGADVISSQILDDTPGPADLRDYSRRCNHEFGAGHKYSLYISKLMHRYPDIFFTAFTGSDDVLEKSLDVPGGILTHKQFLRWFLPRVPRYLLLGALKKGDASDQGNG